MNRKALLEKKFPEVAESALAIPDPTKGKNKYLIWIAQQLQKGYKAEDITSTIAFFHENPDRFEQKDIFKYEALKDLEDLVKEMGLSKRQEKEKDKEGATKIFEDDNFLVVRVDDKPAMIAYGANTRWCTTMKDQHYYEDYVVGGNDFYIIITKNPKAAKSSKYAVARKGFLEFQVYDDQDSYARSFSEKEEDLLRNAVQAIVADKPPKNFIRLICNKQIPANEAIEWLKNQSKKTKDFIERHRPDLIFALKSVDELVEEFTVSWNRRHLRDLDYSIKLDIAKILVTKTNKKYIDLKKNILNMLQDNDILLFAADKDPRIRAAVADRVNAETAKVFFDDRCLSVFKKAAVKVAIDFLFDFVDKTKSTPKKKVANEVIIERISKEKVKDFVLKQPREVIKTLMD